MGNINSFRKMQISLQLYRRGGIKHRTKEESIHQHTHTMAESCLSAHVPWRQLQAAASQPVHCYCPWSFCVLGSLAWQPWPSPHVLPTYAWTVTQGHSPVRGNPLHAWETSKTHPASTAGENQAFCMHFKQLWSYIWSAASAHIQDNCKVQRAGFGNI